MYNWNVKILIMDEDCYVNIFLVGYNCIRQIGKRSCYYQNSIYSIVQFVWEESARHLITLIGNVFFHIL